MKKLWLLLLIPILGIAAYLVWQNLPEKRFAKHMIKARLYAKENNLTAANQEYRLAYEVRGKYTPYADLEVLALTNRMAIMDKNPQLALANTRQFTQEYPGNKQGQIILAELAFQLGEMETAFNALDAVLAADPYHFPARLLLTNIRAQQGRTDLAEEQLRYLYGKYPDSVQALLPLADVLLQQGRNVESRDFLSKVLAKDGKNFRARVLMVDSYLKEGKLDSAQRVLDSWKDADPDQIQPLAIRKARLFAMNNQVAEAKSALSAYRDMKEDNYPSLSELAILFVKEGHYDSALAIYKQMGEQAPRARMGMQTVSLYLHLKNNNPARALETIKMLQISDKRPALLAPLIAAYIAIGQDNKAKDLIGQQPDSLKPALNEFLDHLVPDKEFIGQWALQTFYSLNHQDYLAFKTTQDMFKKWPTSPMAISLYTTQLSGIRAYGEAAKILATLKNPDLPRQLTLLQLYASSGQPEKVLPLAEKINREHPDLKGINAVLADLWAKKDKAKSIAFNEKEFALNPENVVVINNLAWEYGINQNNLEKAAPFLAKLKARKNLDPRILDTIGWILACNGKHEEAEKYIRNALDLVPDFPTFQYHLAFVLSKSGKSGEARQALDSALSSKIPFEERKDAEKLRAELG